MTNGPKCERNNHVWRYGHACNRTAIVCIQCGALDYFQDPAP